MTGFHKFLTSAIFTIIFTACFTGIESTPRITADDVRDSGVSTSPEKLFASSVSTNNPTTWQKGQQWYVADNKISLIFTPTSDTDSLAGEIIVYNGHRAVPTVTGENAIEIFFTGPRGQQLIYPTGITEKDFEKRSSLEIPFAINMHPVEVADSLMRKNTYYIKTSLWYDENGNPKSGLRHIPVTIDSVLPGSAIHPLKVAFHYSGSNDTHYVMMTYGNSHAATRNFDQLFAFADPRTQYPHIEDSTWQLIINSQVAAGMTRDECRLALGTPATIERGATHAAQIERWSYNDGIYLIFEDGILARYRK